MTTGLLKPLDVFCSQSQSQRYIKTIRNLGDAWRSLAEKPLTESDKNSVLVETNFDFVLKITNALEGQQSKPTTVEMSTHEPPFSTTSISTTTCTPTESPPGIIVSLLIMARILFGEIRMTSGLRRGTVC